MAIKKYRPMQPGDVYATEAEIDDLENTVQYQNIIIENEIRNAVRCSFPLLSLDIQHDVSRDEYVVAIDNRDVYYSDEYQKLVMDLKIRLLWPAGVDNYFFAGGVL